jgi:RHS repeat-associated protein
MVEQNRSGIYTQIVYEPSGGKLALLNGQTLQKAIVPLPGGGQAVYNSSGLLYYGHSDHLGSIRLGSTPARSMYFSMAYAPFGETYAQSGTTDPAFTAQRQDTVGGLYDFPAREYSIQGRWPSPDPSGLRSVSLFDPQTLNRYAYVRNSPLSMLDSNGLCGMDLARNGAYPDHAESASLGPTDHGFGADFLEQDDASGGECIEFVGGGGSGGGNASPSDPGNGIDPGNGDPTSGGAPSNSATDCTSSATTCGGNTGCPPDSCFTVPGNDPNLRVVVSASLSDGTQPIVETESAQVSSTLSEECGGCLLSQMQNDAQSMAILNSANDWVTAGSIYTGAGIVAVFAAPAAPYVIQGYENANLFLAEWASGDFEGYMATREMMYNLINAEIVPEGASQAAAGGAWTGCLLWGEEPCPGVLKQH